MHDNRYLAEMDHKVSFSYPGLTFCCTFHSLFTTFGKTKYKVLYFVGGEDKKDVYFTRVSNKKYKYIWIEPKVETK